MTLLTFLEAKSEKEDATEISFRGMLRELYILKLRVERTNFY
jgi:hypothetical protein